jgi:hypothetical protein
MFRLASQIGLSHLAKFVQGAQRVSELRHVILTAPSKRENTIDRLPLRVLASEQEDWQSLYEAAGNPTKWYRQPFVIVVLVCYVLIPRTLGSINL